ncbi:chymotrypsinogen A-like [Ornithodoros turicata]|uniref:chymotrypsinogen A-like n=1 Tax=Ornithodoros turicata TaxID=34597 RepID=UPI0031392C2B
MWTLLLLVVEAAAAQYEDVCGHPVIEPHLSDRILGGQEATPGSWPWHAGIYKKRVVPEHFCAGALITRKHVLTAAHCFKGMPSSMVQVHLGSHTRDGLDKGEQFFDVEEICVHPRYVKGNANDIAIVTLKNEAEFTDTVQPICLPGNSDHVPAGTDVYLAGWGISNVTTETMSPHLKQMRTRTVSDDQCNTTYRYQPPDGVFCASHEGAGSSCKGDSGGPLVRKVGDRWVLQGVLTGGPRGCGLRHEPMLFTDVTYFMASFTSAFLNAENRAQKLHICTMSES